VPLYGIFKEIIIVKCPMHPEQELKRIKERLVNVCTPEPIFRYKFSCSKGCDLFPEGQITMPYAVWYPEP
jgi:hypothetical protein